MLIYEYGSEPKETVSNPAPEFRLPARNVTNVNAINYLVQERGISEAIVQEFIDSGDLYEDSGHHNVVFIGRDPEGIPHYAHCRGTGEKFRQDVAGSDKSYGFCYRGSGERLCVFEAPIDLLSFICLFSKDWQSFSYLSLGGVSSKALEHFLSESPNIKTIYLCLDADDAGSEACRRIARDLISKDLEIFRMEPALKDWNEVLLHNKELTEGRFKMLKYNPVKEHTIPMIRMSDVELTEVKWLWKPYIPFGKLTILQGNPGEGETYFAMQLAAACTNRVKLPNMEVMEPFNVIYQTAEDGLGDTVKPRLMEAGANLDRVLVINEQALGGHITLSDRELETAIRENDAKLLIIDPIQAFLGSNVDMNRANEVRPIFRWLGDMAERTGCAIVLIGHLNKTSGMQSTYRGLGSIDFTASVRSLLFIGKVKDDPNLRVLTHEKCSLAPPGESLAFILGDDEGFRWVGEYEITADEMLSGSERRKETKTQEARDLICSMLARGKEALSEDIDREAVKKGISPRTVRDAKRELGSALKSRIGEGRKKIFWME